MKTLTNILFFFCVSILNKTMAQCPDKIQFKTSDMGNGVSQLNIPLLFNISKDSVIITTADVKQETFSSFKVLSKHCQCNEDLSTGTIVYSLQSIETGTRRSAVLTIKLNNKKGKIELLYKDSEPRIFTIQKLNF